jgi:hypothetical protein
MRTRRCAHRRRRATETAGVWGRQRQRSSSRRPDFVTTSVLRWPTSLDESRKSKRRSRRSSGAAHRWRGCTGATEIRWWRKVTAASSVQAAMAHWWSSGDREEQRTCSLTWWSSPWCLLAPGAPRRRIEAGTATTPSRSVGGAMQRSGAGSGEQRLGHVGTGGGFIWARGTRMAWRARHRHRNGGSPDSS